MLGFGRTDLDTIFLDAGNTLVGMDPMVVTAHLRSEGIVAAPEAFVRAEAAARPALSSWLMAGTSSEARATMAFFVARILERLGVADVSLERAGALVAGLRARVPTERLWSRVLPGVPAALAALRAAGLGLVVVSNSDGTVEQALARVGLRDLVDAVVDSAVVGMEKPAPGIFAHALALVGGCAARTLHVGDLYAVDVVGARGLGLHAVLLDPFDDWPEVDCPRVADLAALTRALGIAG
ncbi:MAG: HAD family hydrolase [bacterium]|nr:HAD family hydrolase [bacterium]